MSVTAGAALPARHLVAALAAAIVLFSVSHGIAAEDEVPCERPRIQLLRHEEDYSFLRNPRCRTDLWDPLKYVLLSDDLPARVTLGIDVRERYEYFSTFDWGGDPNGGGYLLQRIMPFASLHLGRRFEVFFQLTSNLVLGRDPRPVDRDDLDVLQAFASLTVDSLTIRAGRQEVQYASSRLVSVREGPNVRQAFDGLRLIHKLQGWQLDTLALVPVEVRPGVFDDRPEPGQFFWGLYASGPVLAEPLGLDVYYLGRYREAAAFEQGTERELRHTFGARVWGTPESLDYNIELVAQAGTFGPGAIAAWTAASDVGYTVDAFPLRPRLGLQVNATSGDATPQSPNLQTFNPLFPRGSYFSQANLIGPLNHIDIHPALTLRPLDSVELTLDWDFFWRQSLGDGLYFPSTLLQVPGAGNPERYVGSQGQTLAQWQPTAHATFGATYSHFFAGPFLRAAGRGQDVDFVGLWVSYAI